MATAKKMKVAPAPLAPAEERLQTLADVYADNGFTEASFAKHCKGLSIDEIGYREAKLIALSFNEGEVMETANTNQVKYFPWFWIQKKRKSKKYPAGFALSCSDYGSTCSLANLGARLGLKSPDLAKLVGNRFPEVYIRLFS